MWAAIIQWIMSHKFAQNTAASVVGTGISAGTLFGIYDVKMTSQLEELEKKMGEKAAIIYVDHQDEVIGINIKDLSKQLDRIERAQEKTNDRLNELRKGF